MLHLMAVEVPNLYICCRCRQSMGSCLTPILALHSVQVFVASQRPVHATIAGVLYATPCGQKQEWDYAKCATCDQHRSCASLRHVEDPRPESSKYVSYVGPGRGLAHADRYVYHLLHLLHQRPKRRQTHGARLLLLLRLRRQLRVHQPRWCQEGELWGRLSLVGDPLVGERRYVIARHVTEP